MATYLGLLVQLCCGEGGTLQKISLACVGSACSVWATLGLPPFTACVFSQSTLTFIGRDDVEAETPTLWPPDVKNWLLGKDPDAEKDWRREEKGTTEDEVVGWHHWLDGHEFEQAPGVGDGQGRLACHSPWGHKELDTAELNWTEKSSKILIPNVKTILKNKFAYLYFYINANIS